MIGRKQEVQILTEAKDSLLPELIAAFGEEGWGRPI